MKLPSNSPAAWGRITAALFVVLTVLVVTVKASTESASQGSSQTLPGTSSQKPIPQTRSPHPQATPSGSLLLTQRVRAFLEAYYTIRYTDTEAARRQRLSQVVPASFLNKLDLGLGEGTAGYEASLAQKQNQTGTVVGTVFADPVDPTDKTVQEVRAVVHIVVSSGNGEIDADYPQATTSTWQKRGGTWNILTFTEGGDTG